MLRTSLEIIEYWEELIHTLMIAAIIMDGDGCVRALNFAFAALFGFEGVFPREVDLNGLFRVPLENTIKQNLQTGKMTQPFGKPLQVLARKRSGEEFLAEITILPVIGGEVIYLILIRDVGGAQLKLERGFPAVTKRVIEVQEEERRRIARDLHDETAQQIFALKMQLLSLKADGPEPLYAGVSRITAGVDTILQDLRQVIMDLRPKILDDFGLHEAILFLVQDIEKRTRLMIDYKLLGINPDRRFSPDIELAAYRIVKEVLNNIVRHSKASSTLLRMSMFENQLIVVVQDDGIGFHADQIDVQNCHGISGMTERAAILGGCVEIKSFKGQGTVVVVELPFQQMRGKYGE